MESPTNGDFFNTWAVERASCPTRGHRKSDQVRQIIPGQRAVTFLSEHICTAVTFLSDQSDQWEPFCPLLIYIYFSVFFKLVFCFSYISPPTNPSPYFSLSPPLQPSLFLPLSPSTTSGSTNVCYSYYERISNHYHNINLNMKKLVVHNSRKLKAAARN